MRLNRRGLLGGCAYCLAVGLMGCEQTGGQRVAPGHRPSLATDEGALWHAMDKAEGELKRSRFTIRDEALNGYVGGIVERLADTHGKDVRVYLTRTAHFNATMAPNGMMQVWSGLLLRSRNEAQLAAVLGHEIGHYLHQHSLQNFRTVRNTADVLQFLSIGLALAGVGAAGSFAQLIAVASLFAYNREQEREADKVGLELMTKAGYAPLEAAAVWEQIIAETNVDPNKKSRDVFFATHPDPEERMTALRQQATAQPGTGAEPHAERFRLAMKGFRGQFLQDELRLRQPERTLIVLDRLAVDGQRDVELLFYEGEVYRLRDADGDRPKARAAYERAIGAGTPTEAAPPEAWRGLGMLAQRDGDKAAARAAFERYLQLKPDASDREIVRSYLTGA
jgi:beta-barrel assembly-enhancing protease